MRLRFLQCRKSCSQKIVKVLVAALALWFLFNFNFFACFVFVFVLCVVGVCGVCCVSFSFKRRDRGVLFEISLCFQCRSMFNLLFMHYTQLHTQLIYVANYILI